MPKGTYITQEEKSLPARTQANERQADITVVWKSEWGLEIEASSHLPF